MVSFVELFKGVFSRRVGLRVGRTVVTPPSIAEWEQVRSAVTNDTVLADGVPEKMLAGMSPLSLTCFVESIDPEDLALSVEHLKKVKEELEQIARISPLEAYVACLEKLTREGVGGN